MTTSYLLAVDAGTGSGRAVIFNENGNQIASAQHEWWHKTDPRFPGSMDFDVDGNWSLLSRAIRQAIAEAGITAAEIRAVSATSMREAFVVYDRSGREIWACANVDSRAVAEVRDLKRDLPGLERDLYAETGQTFALGALPRLLWLKRNLPDVYDRIDRISMLSDWVLMRLSGVIASDPSNAGTTGLYGLAKRDWLPEAMTKAGMRDDIFPESVEPGTIIGHVTDKAAEETGLTAGTPVVMGGGDCQTGAAAIGVVNEGDCAVLGGTFWQQVVNVGPSVSDPSMDLRINPHVVAGLNQAEAISFFVGMVMRWFRDSFGAEEVVAAGRGGDAYRLLEEKAARVPVGAHGIIPVFSDVMHYGNWYHAAPSLLNLSIDPEKSGKAAIFRALQENAAIVAARNLSAIFKLSGKTPEKIVFAAGASKSAHWSQILSSATGLPVVTPVVKEATALGCAVAAATGIGLYRDFVEAAEGWVRWDGRFEPNLKHKAIYDEAGKRWARAYALQRQLVDEGVTTAMWKAPGL
ncbi:autoinducer-2 (AI-2) kinase [Nitratireductor indicus C115]|uniref:Autoinducer-2 (AI-2) kinase n=1 Tax=Nitratireductor indicus C115 TaxID=1231190 RepID=K2PQC6_9HYPH|nr:autoinducer-2 kinase [Nitratireductor indicus]EKF43247.1 autoinducer-2 (AI-2) kinase [Nitratireductor indicus C115]SFQ54068.1 autoinducer 2 (AI-2) kinase [Nitratireductor indicus]